jgi:hypothetical protein
MVLAGFEVDQGFFGEFSMADSGRNENLTQLFDCKGDWGAVLLRCVK